MKEPGDPRLWADGCWGHLASVEIREDKIIESITVSLLGPYAGECSGNPAETGRLAWKRTRTGRGLMLGDSCERVVALYGQPESRSPSLYADRELELILYSFDWVGSDVPQVMEVSCDRKAGRVAKITLAFPSL